MMRLKKRAATAALATVLSGAALLAAAPSASAWPFNSTVTIKGSDGCGGLQVARVYGSAANGEVHVGDYGWGGNYTMTFGSVPSGGESIRFDVYCKVTGYHPTTRWVTRPAIGITQTVNI